MIEAPTYQERMRALVAGLPPSPNDNKDDFVELAIEQMAAFAPQNAAELSIAAQYVACAAQASWCLRMAADADPRTARMLARQGAEMMRLARDWRTSLTKMQAERRKRDADPVARARHAAVCEAVRCGLQQALAEITAEPGNASGPRPSWHDLRRGETPQSGAVS